jgi:hypothetical protein
MTPAVAAAGDAMPNGSEFEVAAELSFTIIWTVPGKASSEFEIEALRI